MTPKIQGRTCVDLEGHPGEGQDDGGDGGAAQDAVELVGALAEDPAVPGAVGDEAGEHEGRGDER